MNELLEECAFRCLLTFCVGFGIGITPWPFTVLLALIGTFAAIVLGGLFWILGGWFLAVMSRKLKRGRAGPPPPARQE